MECGISDRQSDRLYVSLTSAFQTIALPCRLIMRAICSRSKHASNLLAFTIKLATQSQAPNQRLVVLRVVPPEIGQ